MRKFRYSDDGLEDVESSYSGDGSVRYIPNIKSIFIRGVISEDLSRDFFDLVIDNYKDINTLIINSGGGNVSDGLAIGDVVKDLKLNTVGVGEVFSMGAYLFSLGEKRYALPSTTFMIHNGYAVFPGDMSFNVTQSFQAFWSNIQANKVLDTIIRATNVENKEEMKNHILLGQNVYWTTEDALSCGFVSSIVNFTDLMDGNIS